MLIKYLEANVKRSARKRSVIRVLFYTSIETETKVFRKLQQAFTSPFFLTHYNRTRLLLIDLNVSKSFEFAVMIYHIKQDRILKGPKIARTDV